MKQRITATELKAMTMKELAAWVEFNACAINHTMVMSWGHEELFKGYHIRPEYTGYNAGRLIVKAFHFTSRTRKADAQSFAEWLHWAIFGEYPAEETEETTAPAADPDQQPAEAAQAAPAAPQADGITAAMINSIGAPAPAQTVTVTWANGTRATYSANMLDMLRTDPAALDIQDDTTGEIIYIKPAPTEAATQATEGIEITAITYTTDDDPDPAPGLLIHRPGTTRGIIIGDGAMLPDDPADMLTVYGEREYNQDAAGNYIITTDEQKEEENTMSNTEREVTAAIMATVNRIISTQGGYREKHILTIPHEYQRGETWNKEHKVVYVLNKARDLDGYRPGCAVDIVTRSIVG